MIKGKKVFFRTVERDDLKLLAEWPNDPGIPRLVVDRYFPVSMAQQEEWYLRSLKDTSTQRFIVESYDKNEGAIGLTGLWHINRHDGNALTALKLGPHTARRHGPPPALLRVRSDCEVRSLAIRPQCLCGHSSLPQPEAGSNEVL